MLKSIISHRGISITRSSRSIASPILQSQKLPCGTEITTLSNGLRVATENTPGHFCGLGIYVDAGSRYEVPSSFRGVSHFLDKMAFKSTKTKSRHDITNILEAMGGNVSTTSTRENIMYQATCTIDNIPVTFDLLADTVTSPILTENEMEETRGTILFECAKMHEKPDTRMTEWLHATAYDGKTLGWSQYCSPEHLEVERETLERYRDVFFKPTNLVVAASGVAHEYLVELADKKLGALKGRSDDDAKLRPKAKYVGGDFIQEDSSLDFTQVHFAFESVPNFHEDIYAISTLQMLLHGGSSFSAGGPGKGMYSRFYADVLNQFHWVESIMTMNISYLDSGLFTIQSAVPGQYVHSILDIIGWQFHRLLRKPIRQDELTRAKSLLKTIMFMNLENRLVHAEDIGRQVQIRGRRVSPKEMSEEIEKVTVDDIRRVVRDMMERNPVTVVISGDTRHLPDLKSFRTRFGFK